MERILEFFWKNPKYKKSIEEIKTGTNLQHKEAKVALDRLISRGQVLPDLNNSTGVFEYWIVEGYWERGKGGSL